MCPRLRLAVQQAFTRLISILYNLLGCGCRGKAALWYLHQQLQQSDSEHFVSNYDAQCPLDSPEQQLPGPVLPDAHTVLSTGLGKGRSFNPIASLLCSGNPLAVRARAGHLECHTSRREELFWYIPVCTSMYQCIPLQASICWCMPVCTKLKLSNKVYISMYCISINDL